MRFLKKKEDRALTTGQVGSTVYFIPALFVGVGHCIGIWAEHAFRHFVLISEFLF